MHTCHHPACKIPVAPRMLACRSHWYQLPKSLRNEVWKAYVPGQEITKNPSKEYMAVIVQVQAYWRDAMEFAGAKYE